MPFTPVHYICMPSQFTNNNDNYASILLPKEKDKDKATKNNRIKYIKRKKLTDHYFIRIWCSQIKKKENEML